MIFTAAPAGRKPELDLLVRGAPLRNRTVDLLLTIRAFLGSLPTLCPSGQMQSPARPGIGTCGRPGNMPIARDGPRRSKPSEPAVMGIRHAIQAQAVRLSAARPRPGRRSDDGQTILLPVWQDQKCLAEQPLPLTARRIRTSAPLRASGDGCRRQPGVLPGRRSCHGDHSSPRSRLRSAPRSFFKLPVQDQMHGTGSIRLP
jgi:hypothetical protein